MGWNPPQYTATVDVTPGGSDVNFTAIDGRGIPRDIGLSASLDSNYIGRWYLQWDSNKAYSFNAKISVHCYSDQTQAISPNSQISVVLEFVGGGWC